MIGLRFGVPPDHHFLAERSLAACTGHGRGGQRFAVEAGEQFADRGTQLLLDQRRGDGRVEWGYSVPQHRQFFGDIRRQQVATGRENLPGT